jgi:aryl-alcohol dehydrogenase-like predicted oxidoreductase
MTGWLDPGELRVGLGCMRLPIDESPETARETIVAAVGAGITVYDTARAYDGNEQFVAATLRDCGAAATARIVTKGGMSRAGGAWVPDGRAKTLLADCDASVAALGGLAVDLYLVHSPDPRTPWKTTLRALARLVDDGLVWRVGVANVNRAQLDEALELAPISAVQVALSVFDERALRGGVVERCTEAGIAVIAHSPLGGPRRAGGLARRQALVDIAAERGATPAEVALAWLLGLSPVVVPIPGARRPESARSAAHAVGLALDARERSALAPARPRTAARARRAAAREVVLLMGIPGAGKSRLAADYVDRGYARLNRDERGGTLRAIADALEERLSDGAGSVVLDNTYLTRSARSYAVDASARHGAHVRCVWLDTPLAQAQVNLVERLLDRFGSLPAPEELRRLARTEEGLLLPTQQMRALRELEPPSPDEGFTEVERVAFARVPGTGRAGVFVAAAAFETADRLETDPGAPHLVFDWRPDGTTDDLEALVVRLAAVVEGPVETAICPHGGGPPSCWCRPPLPGLALAFARAHDVDPARSTLIGTSTAHRTLATTLGARYVEA